MIIKIPYVLFKTRTGEYGLDAYFSLNVERVERRATLLRKAEEIKLAPQKPSTALLDGKDVEKYLHWLFTRLYELSEERMKERTKHMRRWNVLRLIGIPTGHQRHVDRDEELARKNREALLALTLVRAVLGVKKPGDFERAGIKFEGYGVFELKVEGKEVNDPVYRELFRVDPIAGMALSWLKIKEIRG